MFYQGNNQGASFGCQSGCQNTQPTFQQCNQVVQTCNVQDVPHYTDFHTHIVNNCIKRHIAIPTYSSSSENVYLDEYVQAAPMYQQPVMFNQPMMYGPGQYQGNVGMDGNPSFANPYNQVPYPNFMQPNNPTVNFNM